jgi:hypothetical protein
MPVQASFRFKIKETGGFVGTGINAISKNVLGEELMICGCEPITGYFRDGFCNTDQTDFGKHTVCAVVTSEFLEYSKAQGNDLTTPRPEFSFNGLKDGDHWCLCSSRWIEAKKANVAPPIILEACHESLLKYISIEELKKFQKKI